MRYLCLLALLFVSPAHAQQVCVSSKGVKEIVAKYKEVLQVQGLTGDNTLLEIYASEDGSFSVFKRYPSGLSCLVESGQGFQLIEVEEPQL